MTSLPKRLRSERVLAFAAIPSLRFQRDYAVREYLYSLQFYRFASKETMHIRFTFVAIPSLRFERDYAVREYLHSLQFHRFVLERLRSERVLAFSVISSLLFEKDYARLRGERVLAFAAISSLRFQWDYAVTEYLHSLQFYCFTFKETTHRFQSDYTVREYLHSLQFHCFASRETTRGGVTRISGLIYKETRVVLHIFLEDVIRDAVEYTNHARRKTVIAMDVVYALKRQGRTLYGFGG
ncbi:hypothetical protein FNV43_RR02347 [Rhamnella rubrinervis]|uniref:Histone H4 n=1 Tax=Rhamnella rubrinervis TaxID=2594499 RepID=A0A8K0HSI0_9ROSA|nr:hypothetical protein FNV43_RR02347 [Rhamnella rubrinervis]